MNNILASRIEGASLTKGQRKIADYFLKNQQRLAMLSSVQIAKEIGVSDASIIRFSRAIGYQGFAALKTDVYRELTHETDEKYSHLSLSERMEQSTIQYPAESIPSQFAERMQQNLSNTFRFNDQSTFSALTDALLRADKKFLIGLRSCYGSVQCFGRTLNIILPGVNTLSENEAIDALLHCESNDIVLLFVLARYYKTDETYAKLAKLHGASLCVVTNNQFSPLKQYADFQLLADTSHMSFFNSTLSITMIEEYILTLISRRLDIRAQMAERDEVIKGLLL